MAPTATSEQEKQKLWNKTLTDTVCTNFKQLHGSLREWITEDINWGAQFDPLNMKAYRRENTF
eukprot:7637136-Ditylum_brightwellii.AAC.1